MGEEMDMTEQEWLASNDPAKMLSWLRQPRRAPHGLNLPYSSERKLRFLAWACSEICDCRHIRFRHWKEYLNRENFHWETECKVTPVAPSLIREIFGNPFVFFYVKGNRPNPLENPDVQAMAKAIYHKRQWREMPILADALEDAGCREETILNHCRNTEQVPCLRTTCLQWHGPCNCKCGWKTCHISGCWVLDLILGKS